MKGLRREANSRRSSCRCRPRGRSPRVVHREHRAFSRPGWDLLQLSGHLRARSGARCRPRCRRPVRDPVCGTPARMLAGRDLPYRAMDVRARDRAQPGPRRRRVDRVGPVSGRTGVRGDNHLRVHRPGRSLLRLPIIKASGDLYPEINAPIVAVCGDPIYVAGIAVDVTINPADNCLCLGPVSAEETTWGRVKACTRGRQRHLIVDETF